MLQSGIVGPVVIALAALAGSPQFCAADRAAMAGESTVQHDARMKWWRDARFGMFIHWGIYAVPAGEWQDKKSYAEWFLEETHMPVSQYAGFAKQFNPVDFDAKQWVRIAKDAGMKYLVITSKHHDGFCMWPSKLTDWCISSTPFGRSGRDPLRELADACQEGGIHFGLYYSIMDWHHSDWATRRAWNDVATGKPDMDRYTAYLKGQLKELITNYHPAVLWFDGEWESPWTHERGVDVYNYLRTLDPNLIINNRVDTARNGMAGMSTDPHAVDDFGTPEQEIPANGLGPGIDWETCMTLNDHWGYNKYDKNWKSAKTIVRNLVDIASKGGNYLLNVGPTAEGVIAPGNVDRLEEAGRWMKVNGEAIYGASAAPFVKMPAWGRYTQKPGTLYLNVFDWPKDRKISVPITNKVNRAYLLSAPDQTLPARAQGDAVQLEVSGLAPDPIATVIALEIDGQPKPSDAAP
jgi:alpha-L-fucosidase